jgi:signal transduction histidine kinase
MTTLAGEIPAEAAASDLMRLIAHELRQPLSTIGSIAYYLTLILPRDDDKVHEQLVRLQHLVEQSSWILTNGQHLTESIQIVSEPVNIGEVIEQSIAARSAAGDLPMQLELSGDPLMIQADPVLTRALVENLLTLFRLAASAEHPVVLRTARTARGVCLEIATRTPGFRSEASLGPGSTLAVECARRITERHGGTLEITVDPSSGIRTTVVLP